MTEEQASELFDQLTGLEESVRAVKQRLFDFLPHEQEHFPTAEEMAV